MLIVPSAAFAQNVTPVGATASSTFSSEYVVDNLINDSGLTAGLHDGNYANMWMADQGDVTPWLVFDLGGLYELGSASIWQYNSNIGYNRGVQGLRILLSTDGGGYTLATTTTLTESAGGSIPAQTVSFTGTARYVRFEVTSNYGANFTGLSEVKFTGEAQEVPDPIPAAGPLGLAILALALAGLAILALHRRV